MKTGIILFLFSIVCCTKLCTAVPSINLVDALPAIGDLVGGLKTNDQQIAAQLVPTINALNETKSSDIITALKAVAKNEMTTFGKAASSVHGFANELLSMDSAKNQGSNPNIIAEIPRALVNKVAVAIQQISDLFNTEAGQFNALMDNLENAITKVTITPDGFISMPVPIQQDFITIVDGLSKSSTETGTLIMQIESELVTIQSEIEAKMSTSSSFVNDLLNVLYGILTGIGNSYDSIGEDVQVIANSFEDLGNIVGKPGSNVLIPKEKFEKAVDNVLDNVILAYGNIENHAGLLEGAIQYFERMLVQIM